MDQASPTRVAHLKRYPTKVVTSNKMLPKVRRQPRGWRHKQDGNAGIVGHAEKALLELLQEGQEPILDEFIAITGHHRKHGIRLLGQLDEVDGVPRQARSRRIYDAAVREAVIVIWEVSDRICGKRLKAAMPHLVESMERHGHLDLDPEVRDWLLAASAATLDRLLKPIRSTAGSRRRRRRKRSLGKRVTVRTYNDWNGPPPGFLEIDLVVHSGGPLSGSFIHSLVATDVCTGWTEAVPLLTNEQS